MRRFTPHVAFFFVYAGLLHLAGFAVEQVGLKTFGDTIGWIAPFFAAPIALLAAGRFGRMGGAGVAVTSSLLVVLVSIAIVGILVWIAIPVVGPVDVDYVLRAFKRYFTLGGWSLLWSALIMVGAPLLWSRILPGRPAASMRVTA